MTLVRLILQESFAIVRQSAPSEVTFQLAFAKPPEKLRHLTAFTTSVATSFTGRQPPLCTCLPLLFRAVMLSVGSIHWGILRAGGRPAADNNGNNLPSRLGTMYEAAGGEQD